MNQIHPINVQAWAEWVEYRTRELKKKVGPRAEKKQRQMLAGYPPAIQQHIIDTSIGSSWQGLFPPKVGRIHPQHTGKTRDRALTDFLTDKSWAD